MLCFIHITLYFGIKTESLAHCMQCLQWGCPLYADSWLRPACGARWRWAGPGYSGDTELFHATGATPFHKSADTIQTDGGKEAAQEELWSSIQFSAWELNSNTDLKHIKTTNKYTRDSIFTLNLSFKIFLYFLHKWPQAILLLITKRGQGCLVVKKNFQTISCGV